MVNLTIFKFNICAEDWGNFCCDFARRAQSQRRTPRTRCKQFCLELGNQCALISHYSNRFFFCFITRIGRFDPTFPWWLMLPFESSRKRKKPIYAQYVELCNSTSNDRNHRNVSTVQLHNNYKRWIAECITFDTSATIILFSFFVFGMCAEAHSRKWSGLRLNL